MRPREAGRAARPAPARAAPARATGRSRPGNGSGRAFRRLVAFVLIALVFTAAVAVAVVVATSTSSTVVHFRTVVAQDAQSAITSVRNIINQYTK